MKNRYDELDFSISMDIINLLCFFFQTNIGPIVLSVNSFREIGNPLTLTSTQEVTCPELAKVVEEAVRLQNESGYPQTIIGKVEKIIIN